MTSLFIQKPFLIWKLLSNSICLPQITKYTQFIPFSFSFRILSNTHYKFCTGNGDNCPEHKGAHTHTHKLHRTTYRGRCRNKTNEIRFHNMCFFPRVFVFVSYNNNDRTYREWVNLLTEMFIFVVLNMSGMCECAHCSKCHKNTNNVLTSV